MHLPLPRRATRLVRCTAVVEHEHDVEGEEETILLADSVCYIYLFETSSTGISFQRIELWMKGGE